jgi:hypothetical protein
METYLDGTGNYTYGTANQCPEVGYWILKTDTKLWILVFHLDTEKKYKFQTLLWGMLVLLVISRENFDNGHFELFNFPGRWVLRPAFFTGIKPCDVIIHKVNWAVWCRHWNTPLYTNAHNFFLIILFAVLTEYNLNHLYNEWCHLKLTY